MPNALCSSLPTARRSRSKLRAAWEADPNRRCLWPLALCPARWQVAHQQEPAAEQAPRQPLPCTGRCAAQADTASTRWPAPSIRPAAACASVVAQFPMVVEILVTETPARAARCRTCGG